MPNRLAAFAVTPLPHVDAALRELTRALDELKMAGAVIGSSVLGRSLADRVLSLFIRSSIAGAPFFMFTPPASGRVSVISPHAMTWVIGAPIEDTVAAFHLIVQGHSVSFP